MQKEEKLKVAFYMRVGRMDTEKEIEDKMSQLQTEMLTVTPGQLYNPQSVLNIGKIGYIKCQDDKKV